MAESIADDLSISDEDELWRRIPRRWIVFDENRGSYRPASAAFDDNRDGSMSVFLESVMVEIGRTPEHVLIGHHGYGLCGVAALIVRQQGQIIVRRPTEAEPAHAEVVGHKSQGVTRRISREARWIIQPIP